MSIATDIRSPVRERPGQEQRNHYPALDGVRGIAIIAVVAFHVAGLAARSAPWFFRSSPPAPLWPAMSGFLGVDVFFVLSGFLVLRSWQSLRARHGGRVWRSIASFARRRAGRILPPYWFSLAVLIPWLVPHWIYEGRLRNILMFVSVQQFLDTDLPHHVNTVTWSLTTEVHFYLLMPVLAFLMIRFGWARVLAGTLAVSVLWRFLVGPTGSEAEWILGRADQFVAGMSVAMLLAHAAEGREPRTMRLIAGRYAGWVLGAALLTIALIEGALRGVPKPGAYSVFVHPMAGLCIAALLARVLETGGPRVLAWRGLRMIGLVSYSLFLWHWPLLKFAAIRWEPSALVLSAALVAAVAVSLVSYRLFERPLARA